LTSLCLPVTISKAPIPQIRNGLARTCWIRKIR
jgi:hypothetical protein